MVFRSLRDRPVDTVPGERNGLKRHLLTFTAPEASPDRMSHQGSPDARRCLAKAGLMRGAGEALLARQPQPLPLSFTHDVMVAGEGTMLS